MVVIENVDINLNDTLTCGQIFRYTKEDDNSYTVITADRVINIKQDKDKILVKSSKEKDLEKFIRHYLDLDRDYITLNKLLIDSDNSLEEIINKCNGFKIMNQPKFETIISYILSSNNRVPQIAKALNNISERYGDKIIFEGKEYYLFPTQKQLSKCNVDDLRKLKTGFRDKYIYEFVNKVNKKEIDLDKIDTMSSEDAMKYLMNNKGIGEKVASCILLFGYSRLDVFPIDTWVKKYMNDEYGIKKVEDIRKFTKDKYGGYSGLAIQYMFHYKRNKEEIMS